MNLFIVIESKAFGKSTTTYLATKADKGRAIRLARKIRLHTDALRVSVWEGTENCVHEFRAGGPALGQSYDFGGSGPAMNGQGCPND